MSSLSQRQQGIVPTPLSAIDDPLAKDLMMSSPTYRARIRAATSSPKDRPMPTASSFPGGNGGGEGGAGGRGGVNGGGSGGGGNDNNNNVASSAGAPPRGMSHAHQWKLALDRRQSFDPQEHKHNQQQRQATAKPAAAPGPSVQNGGFTERR